MMSMLSFFLLASAELPRALAYLEANHAAHLDKQVQITEIPAPTFHEAERPRFMAQEFRRVGLEKVEIANRATCSAGARALRPTRS